MTAPDDQLPPPREVIAGLSPDEAVEYLLDLLQYQAVSDRAALAQVMDVSAAAGVPLPRCEAQVFLALYDAKGRTVLYETLLARLEDVTHRFQVNVQNLASQVKRLREKLRNLGWPVKIETSYGMGYRLILKDPQWALDTDG